MTKPPKASALAAAIDEEDIPPLVACLVVGFDDRKHDYIVQWSRAVAGLDFQGVERKCLPPSIFSTERDLVQFSFKSYVGLSACIKRRSCLEDARFVAACILTSPGTGSVWQHARQLQQLLDPIAENEWLIASPWGFQNYWRQHGPEHLEQCCVKVELSPPLSPSHHMLFVERFLDEFGPLVFPLYRATLVSQRILFMTEGPMEQSCKFVNILHDIGAMPPIYDRPSRWNGSNIGIPKLTEFDSCAGLKERLHEVNTIDISTPQPGQTKGPMSSNYNDRQIEGFPKAKGWIACSSDPAFRSKHKRYDVGIDLRDTNSNSSFKTWPKIVQSDTGAVLRATRRDVRRYTTVRQTLYHLAEFYQPKTGGSSPYVQRSKFPRFMEGENLEAENAATTAAQLYKVDIPNANAIVQPRSWAEMGFDIATWTEQDAVRTARILAERDKDLHTLLSRQDVLSSPYAAYILPRGYMAESSLCTSQYGWQEGLGRRVVSYFQKNTQWTLRVLARRVHTAREHEEIAKRIEEGQDQVVRAARIVYISADDMLSMSLDPWSQADKQWVKDMARVYFGREAEVQGASFKLRNWLGLLGL